MVDIFRGTHSETMNIRNLIENNNIEVFTVNELMSTLEPWTVTSGGFNPVTLKVKVEDFQAAREIVFNFENGNLDLEKE